MNTADKSTSFEMTRVEKLPVVGRQPSCAYRSRIEEKRARNRALLAERARKPDKPEEFMIYESSDDEDEDESLVQRFLRTSYNFADYFRSRELNLKERRAVNPNFPARHMISHELFKEHPVPLGNLNKVFCSQWLSDRQIVFGTKCNKLMVYDVNTRKLDQIPLIASGTDPLPNQEVSGIHSVRLNPSRTLLATSGKNPNELAVYGLPTMEPLYIGENVHTDWIFDCCWLDDQFIVTGSRDSQLGLWKVRDDQDWKCEGDSCSRVSPLSLKLCKKGHKVRALAYNNELQDIAALSLNGYLHLTHSRKLPSSQENVCIAIKDRALYGIGCRSHTILIDPRTLFPIKKVSAKFSGCGVRCVSFRGDIMTIGTGLAMVMFYDLRAQKYVESRINSSRTVSLKCSRGYVFPDEEYVEQPHVRYTPAVYTHCYDYTGTRLFTAGGPLPTNIYGNYAGLWQ